MFDVIQQQRISPISINKFTTHTLSPWPYQTSFLWAGCWISDCCCYVSHLLVKRTSFTAAPTFFFLSSGVQMEERRELLWLANILLLAGVSWPGEQSPTDHVHMLVVSGAWWEVAGYMRDHLTAANSCSLMFNLQKYHVNRLLMHHRTYFKPIVALITQTSVPQFENLCH